MLRGNTPACNTPVLGPVKYPVYIGGSLAMFLYLDPVLKQSRRGVLGAFYVLVTDDDPSVGMRRDASLIGLLLQ